MKIVTKWVNNLLIKCEKRIYSLKIRFSLSRKVVIKLKSKMTPKEAIGGTVMSKYQTTPSVTPNTPTVNRDY